MTRKKDKGINKTTCVGNSKSFQINNITHRDFKGKPKRYMKDKGTTLRDKEKTLKDKKTILKNK